MTVSWDFERLQQVSQQRVPGYLDALRAIRLPESTEERWVFNKSDIEAMRGKFDKIRGLGDVISKVTKAVGIRECGGCKKRREALNRMVPFGRSEPTA